MNRIKKKKKKVCVCVCVCKTKRERKLPKVRRFKFEHIWELWMRNKQVSKIRSHERSFTMDHQKLQQS